MKTIKNVQIGDVVCDAYNTDFVCAVVKTNEQGVKYYANVDFDSIPEEEVGWIIPVSDFNEVYI